MNHLKLNVRMIAAMLVLLLAGCDSIPFIDTSSDYKSAGRSRPLEVPPDLTSVSASDTYSVPGTTTYSNYSQGQGGPQLEQEKVLVNPDNVRMERAGAQRWLVVDAPAEKIWPVIREFWNDLGFAIRVENPETGLMETEWIESDALKAKQQNQGTLEKFDKWLDKLSGFADRKKFRTRLERNGESGTTEIYMTHREVSTAPDDGKARMKTPYGEVETGYRLEDKKPRDKAGAALDDDIDAELLRRLMVKLGVEEKRSQAIASAAVTEKRADIVKEKDGGMYLNLTDQFDRGWRRVGLALDRIGFVVEDRDRSKGVYYVRYSDVDIDDAPTKKKGFFDKLKFWGDDDEEKPAKAEPKKADDKGVVDKLKFWKADEKNANDPDKQYRVKVDSLDNGGSRVTVADKDGKRSINNTANRIVSLLYEQLK